MGFTDLLPMLQALDYTDKLRVVQFLVLELAKEEDALLTLDEVSETEKATAVQARPLHVIHDLETAYRLMAADEAREAEALA